ncbi:MAG: hypothetical protein RBR09_08735 [Desulfobulbaceae bacterium]|jgi:hypothetical protein|nr:hypothetical protein [Desulfobulbaceae bacterium]MDY0351326.1 hypothetical protein [Desulfobulbaceae bacterium]
MPFTIQRVQYFYTTVKDQPGEAYKLLNLLAGMGINQLAFSAIPIGPNSTQLAIFPEDPAKLVQEAKTAGMHLDGPHHALLIQGDDELGALAGIHQKLYEAGINVYASTGVTDGRGSYGYLIYIREDDFDRALKTLGI